MALANGTAVTVPYQGSQRKKFAPGYDFKMYRLADALSAA
jgi:hypothetical protein